MAEAIGTAASVITLLMTMTEGIKCVIDAYRAPKEIKTLREQVQLFQDILQPVEDTCKDANPKGLEQALEHAHSIVLQLHNIITAKAGKNAENPGQGSVMIWMKNRRTIARLRQELTDVKLSLIGALSLEALSGIRSMASNLTVMSQQQLSQSSSTQTALEESEKDAKAEFQDHGASVLPRIHQVPESSLAVVVSTSRSVSPFTSDSSEPVLKRRRFGAKHSSRASSASFRRSKARKASTPPQYEQEPGPASALEKSGQFWPAAYTVEEGVMELVCILNREGTKTTYTRSYYCSMLYRSKPWEWTRFTLRITASAESEYWNLNSTDSTDLVPKSSHALPGSLNSLIRHTFCSGSTLEQDSNFSLFLGARNSKKRKLHGKLPVGRLKPLFDVAAYMKQITQKVHHWNCASYSEKGLVLRPLDRYRPRSIFVAFLEGRWVFAHLFGSDKAQIDSQFYNLRLMHLLKDTPGVTKFIGVIRNEEADILTGFLCELPAKGRLFTVVSDANMSDQTIPWSRLEKWSRQLVQAVAGVHEKTFVIGALADLPCPNVCVDGNDDAVLYARFRTRVQWTNRRLGLAPPHNRQDEVITYADTTPQADIYHLGQLLWRIAVRFKMDSALETMTDFTTEAGEISIEGEAPVQLPSLETKAPPYFQEIIAACRRPKPEARPSAIQLLAMFPPAAGRELFLEMAQPEDIFISRGSPVAVVPRVSVSPPVVKRDVSLTTQFALSAKPLTRLEHCYENFPFEVTCDVCGIQSTSRSFHCITYNASDFDLCPTCFLEKGLHCKDSSHDLMEMCPGGTGEKYFTNVTSTGRRDTYWL